MEPDDSPNVVPPVDGLQEQNSALQDQLSRLQFATNSRPATQVLCVPRERKIRSFSGKDGELTLQEFVADIESFFRTREMSDEKRYVSQLQELFYLRKQLEAESIRSFAAALKELLETLTRKHSRFVNDPDHILAEHFAEGLKDRVLRRELKQQ
ncbi:hypothetical protein LSAT2_013722, partial [Lamellibrachia satsuma]